MVERFGLDDYGGGGKYYYRRRAIHDMEGNRYALPYQRTDTKLMYRKFLNGPWYQKGSILLSAFGVPAAGGDCSFTASTIPNLSNTVTDPTIARARARLHTDGDWYSSTGSTGFGISDGTWQGGCAVGDYDSRWNQISGDAPNASVSGADGVWSDAATTGAAIGYDQSSVGTKFGSFSMEIRDASTLNVLFTDTFTMRAEMETP